MVPAIYGTETLTNGKPDTRASRSTVVYFYNFYVRLKLFQNKMFKRSSCIISCFITWIKKKLIKLLVGLFKRFTDHP